MTDRIEEHGSAVLDVEKPADAELESHTVPAGYSIDGIASSSVIPGKLQVIKRNNKVVPYDSSKVMLALTKAFLAVEGSKSAESSSVRDKVESFVADLTTWFESKMPTGGVLHIEDIQDRVELILMRAGEHAVARDYVLYREERRKIREQSTQEVNKDEPITDEPCIKLLMLMVL